MIDTASGAQPPLRPAHAPGVTEATRVQNRVRAAYQLGVPELDAIADLLAVLDRAAYDLPAEVRSAYDQTVAKFRSSEGHPALL